MKIGDLVKHKNDRTIGIVIQLGGDYHSLAGFANVGERLIHWSDGKTGWHSDFEVEVLCK